MRISLSLAAASLSPALLAAALGACGSAAPKPSPDPIVSGGDGGGGAVTKNGDPSAAKLTLSGPTPPKDIGDEDSWLSAWVKYEGFPAVSDDGALVVNVYAESDGARGNENLHVAAWRTKDGSSAFHAVILDANAGDDEPEEEGDEPGAWPTPAIVARAQTALASTQKFLSGHGWHKLAALETETACESNDGGCGYPWLSGDGGVVVRYLEPTLSVDASGGAALYTRTVSDWSAPKEWTCSDTPETPDDPDGCRCENPASLESVWSDATRGVAFVAVMYFGTDMCWEPTEKFVAFRLPNAKSHEGWTAAPREPATLGVEAAWDAMKDDFEVPPSESDIDRLKRFLSHWEFRFPKSAAVAAARAKLAP